MAAASLVIILSHLLLPGFLSFGLGPGLVLYPKPPHIHGSTRSYPVNDCHSILCVIYAKLSTPCVGLVQNDNMYIFATRYDRWIGHGVGAGITHANAANESSVQGTAAPNNSNM